MPSNKYNDKLNFLGNVIAEKRKSYSMSQNKLAIKMQLRGLDIGSNEISKIEKQERIIKDFELLALKDILKLDFNDLHLDDE